MRLAWVTDLHLQEEGIDEITGVIEAQGVEGVISTGDLCDGLPFVDHLRALRDRLGLPIYFILGNHERYGSSISVAADAAIELDAEPGLFYLTNRDWIDLHGEAALIGHDSWADGRDGDFLNSPVEVRDASQIVDFSGRLRGERLEIVQQLGDAAALILEERLTTAFSHRDRVILAMHPAPYREAAQYEGTIASDFIAPHFVCHAVGQMALRVMRRHPEKELLILCGHAHSRCQVEMRPNLTVWSGWRLAPAPLVGWSSAKLK